MSTILVTGAGSGMGRAAAERYLAEGWNVLALDVAVVPATEGITSEVVDIREREQVDAALDRYLAGGGEPLDAVANVAGVYPPSTLESFSDELYRTVFDVNVLGVLNVIAAAVPHMRDAGAIVNFASVDGFTVSPGQLLYCASKAAVVMITRSVASELAPRRIRVNGIAPGWVDSPANRASGRMEAAADSIPLGRVAQPEEIAEWVWILGGSGRADYMTGETINLSGGAYIR